MPKKNFLPTFLILVVFCLLLLGMDRIGALGGLKSFGEKMTAPVREKIYRSWQRARELGDLRGMWEAKQKIADLEKEILIPYQMLLVRDYSLEKENKALRQQLEAPLPAQMKFLPARTLGLIRYLIIDKGTEDGVNLNMTVVSANIFVGKIKNISPRTSQIILPTDPDFKIGVKTLKTQARGLAVGDFGTRIILDKVLQSETLERDDLIITSGDGEQKDLLIGKIDKIQKVEAEPFQKAEIAPLLDYQRLENVFIIK